MNHYIIIAIILPVLGTTIGSAMVFFLKNNINPRVQKFLLGFASGVMVAASIFSLLQPAINSYDTSDYKAWLIPAIGFTIGIIFLLILDYLTPHIHANNQEEGIKSSKINKTFKMLLAVTIHNIPEGLAVGVVIAGALNKSINVQAIIALSLGIAIQNFPEGAIISMPLKETGLSKLKSFFYGFLSGVVEPIASIIAILLTSFVTFLLPFTLSFAAGAMIYVVVEELIPESNEGNHSNLPTIGFALGFVIMMVLDIALG